MKKRLFNKAVKFYGNQTKFALAIGVSRQFVSMVKFGIKKMPSDKLEKIHEDLQKVDDE